MINIDLKIKDKLEEKRWTMKKFVGILDMSENGYSYMIKNNSIKVETLLKISEILEVPVNYFFEENTILPEFKNKNNANSKSCENCEQLKTQLNDKNEIINLLKEKLEVYENKILHNDKQAS